MEMRWNVKIFLLSLLLTSSAYANVLFLNFNRNNTSVEVTRDWANQHGRQVYVYPSDSIPVIDRESIGQILNELSSTKIEKVIFSGHSGSERFSGKDGVLSREEFNEALQAHPNIRNSVTTVLARGCYSATIGDFFDRFAWQKLFPNLRYLAGHEGKAWSSETEHSQSFMRDFLSLEERFLQASSDQEVLDSYLSFKSHHATEAAVWLKNDSGTFYVSTIFNMQGEAVFNFTNIRQICEENIEKERNYTEVAGMYYQGVEVSYLRPPENTDNGELRKVYSWFLQKKHCYTINAWQKKHVNRPMTLMALLFYNNLTANYRLNINTVEFQQSLDWLRDNTGQNFILPNVLTASRGEIRKFSNDLQSIITNANSVEGLKDFTNTYEFRLLAYHVEVFRLTVGDLDNVAIPFRWLTEDVSYDRPIFVPQRPQRGFNLPF